MMFITFSLDALLSVEIDVGEKVEALIVISFSSTVMAGSLARSSKSGGGDTQSTRDLL
jgi:hypothetical protein